MLLLILTDMKTKEFQTFMFPQNHILSVHSSVINANSLFFIRLASLIYLTVIYIWSMVQTNSALTNIIYLTMQGYFLSWLYFLLVMQDYLINGLGKWGRVFPLANNLKFYIQIIYEIAFCVELPVTIIFWSFLFKILLTMDITLSVLLVNANLHAGPLILLSIDMVFNTFSFPKQHFWMVFIFGLIYTIINLAYTLGAHIIYLPINWVTLLSYGLIIGAFVMTFLMHVLGRYIYNRFKKPYTQSSIAQGLIKASQKQHVLNLTEKTSECENTDNFSIKDDHNLNAKL